MAPTPSEQHNCSRCGQPLRYIDAYGAWFCYICQSYETPEVQQFNVCTTDVAPTVARLLGIEAPAQSEGRVLTEFLEGAAERPVRTLTPTSRALAPRPTTKAKRPKLQGDVTDEQ